ncbi:MAG: PP2C family serine/threonine-protein phosphatase [Longimicrobiales bacterium]
MTLTLTMHGASDRGQVRSQNEDHFLTNAAEGVLIVADGLGGRPSGEVASELAARAAHTLLTSRTWRDGRGDAMADAVEAANIEVASAAKAHEEHHGMGTTLTVLAVDPETCAFVIGHVGDSRAYRLRSGVLEQLTRDHTVAQDLLDAGQLTNPDISQHPFRHLLSRAVGTESELEAEIINGSAEPGDLYLLCTDGLVGVVDDETVATTLVGATSGTLESMADKLIGQANERGGPDNITVGFLAVS